MSLIVFGMSLPWLILALFAALGAWVGFKLIHQNGRLLSRLEGVEARLGEFATAQARVVAPPAPEPAIQNPKSKIQNPQGLPLGSPAPSFELPDLNGERKLLADFLGRKLLLIFFNPGCGFCRRMAPDLADLSPSPSPTRGGVPEAREAVLPLVLTTGDPASTRELFEEHGIRCPVLAQEGMEIGARYRCHGTPMGHLIDEQGRIASEMAAGALALLALASSPPALVDANGNGHGALGGKRPLSESKIERNGLPAGSPAPEFMLPGLDGAERSLSDYRGKKLLLVFSDPKCGPCNALMPPLEEAYRRSGAVEVLMISRGDPEGNRKKAAENGLTFPVLLQRQWEISREYGMFATPIAYLIDEQGVTAADIGVGVEPILSLLATAAAQPALEPRCRCGKPAGQCGCGKPKMRAAARQNGR